jgi:pyruvate carboxylase subunit A
MFDTVLVANRGEVARRVQRACRELGVRTVAVHSDADEEAPFVREADQALRIGPSAPSKSYLHQDAIVEAALEAGADAVHPGYGFLSENPAFAEAVQDADLTWIGPDPEAMDRLGDKVTARQLAIETDVPVSPGSEDALEDPAEAREVADEVGYPVMLKAAAGGGGMGMRVVHEPDEMEEAFEGASQQAESAFGDGSMFLERYLERPRHVEVQVVCGPDGDAVHLYERECSIQRRHQKLVEEAPSPALEDEERERVGRMAARLAEAGGYTNAGTLEFLYSDGEFFFNEMNTRLQVEHPVTEMITGVDLVHEQLRVAAGRPVDIAQDDVPLDGHAIEVRVNAEDPYDGFLPRFGTVSRYEEPTGEGLRVESGVEAGWKVPADYDSLLAKVIAWGPTRRKATRRLAGAVADYELGCTTNLPLHRCILDDEAFLEGDLHTGYLEERGLPEALEGEGQRREATSRTQAAAITAALALGARGGLGLTHHRQTRPARVDDGEGGA